MDRLDQLLLWLVAAAAMGLFAVFLWPVLQDWRNHPRPGAQVCQRYTPKDSTRADATILSSNYLLYLPPEYDVRRKWPLVVYLHGVGACGQDPSLLRRTGPPKQIDLGKRFNFILVSPQCPERAGWEPDAVIELTEHISSTLSVDRDRVYLTGDSMGGFGVWAAAGCDPDRFAAVMPLCGGGDVSQAARLANLSIWAFHGAKDEVVPLAAGQRMVDAVRKCGGRVELTIYPDRGHNICDFTYQNPRIYEWLLAQQRQPAK